MNYLITGGTGFVGQHLVHKLHQKGHHTYILTRTPKKYMEKKLTTYIPYDFPVTELPPIYGVINLAGESLFGYWTKQKKKKILNSRIETTEHVVSMMEQMDKKPEVFISGSAVGFYGTSNEKIFTESTTTPGEGFLADVVVEWEKTSKKAEQLGIRTVLTRFGVILGKEGALPLMNLPVRYFVGGKVGNGEQWMSWVHVEDVVEMILYCTQKKAIRGPVNVTAPKPRRNKDFMKTLAKVMKRPHWLPTPSPMFRAATGEMSQLVLQGQYVYPKRLEEHGYTFLYPDLESALKQIYQ